ncbi:helix-turn-helix domain-containing protein [Kitasatospora sp. NPDC056327]|uniref:helix-turn-helix domain-containing protein n=1 Tax=Kitasatospora sp. NPDC056327 TaxID=3345785 RepID=UPI0035D7B93D
MAVQNSIGGPHRNFTGDGRTVLPGAPGKAPGAETGAPPQEWAGPDLGTALRRLRLERGLSMRALAQRLGYSAHSVFSDIEAGRRIPSETLTGSYEECFGLPPGSLLALRRRALADRARRLTERPAPDRSPAPAQDPPAPAAVRPAAAPARPGTPAPPDSVLDAAARLAVAVLTRTRVAVDRWRG